LVDSSYNIVSNNTAFNNPKYGIVLEGLYQSINTSQNILANNNISNNTNGIYLLKAKNNVISDNNIFNATTDNWGFYNPSMPQFSDLKELESGRGYFIQMTEDATWSES